MQAMGDVDELNSQLGVLLCETLPDDVRTLLLQIQHELFNLGGELSIPGQTLLKAEAVAAPDAALSATTQTCRRWPSSSCRWRTQRCDGTRGRTVAAARRARVVALRRA